MNLTIGSVVEPWGKIGAMMITCGEPYYMLSKGGVVSLLPAKMVLHHAKINEESTMKRKSKKRKPRY